ncbi:23S rRNA (adenine(2030)-N(6))-methyltransferase RlmJ [Methylobacillus arboreus]|uniref:23S rRNA (adenine(2030)-N(6))-methyltransferase RlmJ n=1 Tax=Methylobacillus arboreus TaxID=755170 RepID=UPI001E31CA76|nr:23S rRNA (adenine(2030)-N(6))-methyltransferase RlmJ [Methylobacillus arboreus]MCB5189460.1 23S rRNA (adenine(2030)-N(6))-methyltransferase RlmJ [Methylobacillus arboreus]
MLSYRHAFHAGNHADVLKHFVLHQVLSYSNQKDKPYWYVDSHAGAGMYALDHGYAMQNAEFEQGIARLWQANDLPPALQAFIDLVRQLNPGPTLKRYPGSPNVAQLLLRPHDRMRLFELHPTDAKLLRQHFKPAGRQVLIEQEDGFAGLKALLPPPPRRAVVLIDPPYEEKRDYQRVVEALKDSLQRFATGTYLLWYPLLQRPEIKLLQEKLPKLGAASWLHATLSIQAPSEDGFGMHGSGIFVINPPWTLPETLNNTLPYLAQKLALDDGASFTLEHQIP